MTHEPQWANRGSLLLRGGRIMGDPASCALLIEGARIAWIGDDATRIRADEVIDLDGARMTPGFVDAHVHATSTGLSLIGLDLSATSDLEQALDLIAVAARGTRALIGHGWDESGWPQQRPPTLAEVDRAVGDAVAYISRIDVHSALASSALLDLVPGVREMDGFTTQGALTRAAHHAVREVAQTQVARERRGEAQRATRARAASLGIVSLQEMAGPVISSEADLEELLSLAHAEPGPLVQAYWGELAQAGGIERARALGAIGVGGDLFVDGSIGSRTASLRQPYLDDPHSRGAQYISEEEIRAHVRAATEAGMQAGFHVIGDDAADAVVDALAEVAEDLGDMAVRALRHRLEHAEMLDDRHLGELARLGVSVSMQPVFDALWGGTGGMYERRLGPDRMRAMNRFRSIDSAGILMAFGSDAPVTPMGAWTAIDAAVHHHQPGERVDEDTAFAAHTRAAWRAIGCDDAGLLTPGAPAHVAVWEEHDRGQALCTIVAGRIVHESGALR